MVKSLGRKGIRRAHKPLQIDDDLAELAEVLSEYSLDNTAYGWFRPPWRNGAHAIDLARWVAGSLKQLDDSYPRNYFEILNILDDHPRDIRSYEKAGKLFNELIQPKLGTDVSRLLAAALRCLQVKIANSHGGGATYNEILIPAFLPLEPATVEKHVLEYRCRDAIGTTSHLQGDKYDRERSAFKTAWKRGLYFLAYSIRPPGSEIQ